jgi:glycosyltransferase involved in cell wall biosynthesis
LADRIVCVSAASRDVLPAGQKHKAEVVHNAADLLALAQRRLREAVREEWGIGRKYAIGLVSRWSKEKNPLALSAAVAALGEEFVAVVCSPDCDGGNISDRQRVERETNGRVVWTYARENQIGDVYRSLDCLLIPSHEEGGPRVAPEAWACGCPVVSTAVGMMHEFPGAWVPVSHNPSGDELAAAVRMAISPAWRPRVDHARNLAVTSLNAKRMARDWERILRSMVEGQ